MCTVNNPLTHVGEKNGPELNTKMIRNVCLMGHAGSGKTSLAEAMLYCSKSTDRLGSIADKNTVSDFDPEEIKREYSISLTVEPLIWKDAKINIIDVPGFLDFAGEVKEGVRVADAALITVDGRAGLEVGAELAWDYAQKAKLPTAFFINKSDDPEARFGKVYGELREKFGAALCPLNVPVAEEKDSLVFVNLIDMQAYKFDAKGIRYDIDMTPEYEEVASKYKDSLNEAIAQTSEDLLDKFFSEEVITRDEAIEALHTGIITGSIVPVYCGSATRLWGVYSLLDAISESFPRHTAKENEKIVSADGVADMKIEPEGETAVYVFKTMADQFGKISMFKVMNGTLKKDSTLINSRTGGEEKMAHISTIRGKKQTEVDSLCCGDIGVISKLDDTGTCDTLSSSGKITYTSIEFPTPYYCRAIQAVKKGDDDKISGGMAKMLDEDKTIRFENNSETNQLCIYGLGDIHLDIVVNKLKSRYGVNVTLNEPKIAYRETIKKLVDCEGKHKKQSGGSGQYGHVKMRFSHGDDEGLTFIQTVVGGNVPKGYYPAVEKGLLEAMKKGVLAGYPVVHLKADLYDGSYHPVDSNEISFKLAAKLAYKNGLPNANPVLLEPVGKLVVSVPESMIGDVMGDLNKRRGRIAEIGVDPQKTGYQTLKADVPKAEMVNYVINLRAMTQGRGSFEYEVTGYDEVPANISQKIIDDSKKEVESED